MSRWIVEATGEDFNDVHVVRVRKPTDAPYNATRVWVQKDGSAACVSCSGPLVAMLSTCPHARAAARAFKMKKIIPLKKETT